MPKIPSLSLLGFSVRLYKAVRFSRSLLDEVEADVVIGMGGFTSFPPVYAAHRKGIRTYVHDSNALPGKANRMTAKCCTNVLLGIEEARHYFNPAKCIVTGTPVRQEMVARKDKRSQGGAQPAPGPPRGPGNGRFPGGQESEFPSH